MYTNVHNSALSHAAANLQQYWCPVHGIRNERICVRCLRDRSCRGVEQRPARQPHKLKVGGSNPPPATNSASSTQRIVTTDSRRCFNQLSPSLEHVEKKSSGAVVTEARREAARENHPGDGRHARGAPPQKFAGDAGSTPAGRPLPIVEEVVIRQQSKHGGVAEHLPPCYINLCGVFRRALTRQTRSQTDFIAKGCGHSPQIPQLFNGLLSPDDDTPTGRAA